MEMLVRLQPRHPIKINITIGINIGIEVAIDLIYWEVRKQAKRLDFESSG
jgi:hypothetical protein